MIPPAAEHFLFLSISECKLLPSIENDNLLLQKAQMNAVLFLNVVSCSCRYGGVCDRSWSVWLGAQSSAITDIGHHLQNYQLEQDPCHDSGTVDIVSKTWCLTSTETIGLSRDGGEGGGGGGYGVEGRGRLYTYHYTVTTRMIPALRWAAMRTILMFQ